MPRGSRAWLVRILLEDGTEYPQPGRLLFSDLTVDATSGQITLRAEVPNANGVLLPGLYVRVRLEQAKAGNAVLLPQQAVTRTGQGDTVMVVDKEGKVGPRNVKIGNEQGGQWVVLDGLKAGEHGDGRGFPEIAPERAREARAVDAAGCPAGRGRLRSRSASASAAKK